MRLPHALAFAVVLASLPARAETYLILPFSNQSPNRGLDWIGESIADSIRETLNTEGVLTIDRAKRAEAYSRLSVRPYALLTKASVIKIAETCGANQVLYGQFEVEKDDKTPPTSRGTLRISAQILDLERIKRGPDLMTVGALEDLAALQTHLAWRTLHFVAPQSAPPEEEFRKRRPPVRVDAMEHYVRGILSANEEQKVKFLQQAAKLDARYSPPSFELGHHYWEREDYRSASDWLARIGPLDDRFLEANFMRGIARFELKDFAGAQNAFETVLKTAPLNEVQNNLGAAMLRLDLPDAEQHFAHAIEGDPNDPTYHFNLGYARWRRGDFEGATASLRAALARDPEDEEAKDLLNRIDRKVLPVKGDTKTEALARLKFEFELSAFLQLRSILEGPKGKN